MINEKQLECPDKNYKLTVIVKGKLKVNKNSKLEGWLIDEEYYPEGMDNIKKCFSESYKQNTGEDLSHSEFVSFLRDWLDDFEFSKDGIHSFNVEGTEYTLVIVNRELFNKYPNFNPLKTIYNGNNTNDNTL